MAICCENCGSRNIVATEEDRPGRTLCQDEEGNWGETWDGDPPGAYEDNELIDFLCKKCGNHWGDWTTLEELESGDYDGGDYDCDQQDQDEDEEDE